MIYQFKGLIRWSKVQTYNINIHNIESMKQRKRIFCLFDKDKPYSLDVVHITDYNNTNNIKTHIYPFYKYVGLTTFRYKTKEECNDEINIINKLKNLIDHEKNIKY